MVRFRFHVSASVRNGLSVRSNWALNLFHVADEGGWCGKQQWASMHRLQTNLASAKYIDWCKGSVNIYHMQFIEQDNWIHRAGFGWVKVQTNPRTQTGVKEGEEFIVWLALISPKLACNKRGHKVLRRHWYPEQLHYFRFHHMTNKMVNVWVTRLHHATWTRFLLKVLWKKIRICGATEQICCSGHGHFFKIKVYLCVHVNNEFCDSIVYRQWYTNAFAVCNAGAHVRFNFDVG